MAFIFLDKILTNLKAFKDVNFADVSMDGTWSSCLFNKIDFTDSDLEGASFSKAKIIN
jgi:uncharacterized protein YjbI with pentapeptide repeats